MAKNIFFEKKKIMLNQLFPKISFKKNFLVEDVKSLSIAGKNELSFFDSINYKISFFIFNFFVYVFWKVIFPKD